MPTATKSSPRPRPRVIKVNARLFTEDVKALKQRAKAAGEIEWHPLLRKLVHEALRLHAWKFSLSGEKFHSIPGCATLEASGILAIVVEVSEEAARARLTTYAAEFGLDSRWLAIAKVTRIPIDKPCTLGWAEV